MSAITVAVLTPGEAAFLLRRELGAKCAWDDLLADQRAMKRGEWHGLLIPHSIRHGRRPYYRLTDLKRFITAAKLKGLAHSNPADLSVVRIPLAA